MSTTTLNRRFSVAPMLDWKFGSSVAFDLTGM